jgi:hypothetical protein
MGGPRRKTRRLQKGPNDAEDAQFAMHTMHVMYSLQKVIYGFDMPQTVCYPLHEIAPECANGLEGELTEHD